MVLLLIRRNPNAKPYSSFEITPISLHLVTPGCLPVIFVSLGCRVWGLGLRVGVKGLGFGVWSPWFAA